MSNEKEVFDKNSEIDIGKEIEDLIIDDLLRAVNRLGKNKKRED